LRRDEKPQEHVESEMKTKNVISILVGVGLLGMGLSLIHI